MMGIRAAIFAAAVFALIVPSPAAAVLLVRYGWAPLFCFAGSKAGNEVPREFCGLTPPAIKRFTAWRALRIYPSNATSNDPKDCPGPAYKARYLNASVSAALNCVSPSYGVGTQHQWNEYIWKAAGTCTWQHLKYGVNMYFNLVVSIFKRYDVDMVLRKAGMKPGKNIDTKRMLNELEKAFGKGKRGYFTCDPGTKTKISNLYFCLSSKAPHNIIRCPAKYYKPNTCPQVLKWPTENSIPVTKKCLPHYPAYAAAAVGR